MKWLGEYVRNNSLIAAAQISVQLQTLLFVPLVIKSSGPAVYGSFALLSSFMSLIIPFSSLGVGFKYRRYLPGVEESRRRAELFYPRIWFQVLSLGACSAVIAVSWPLVSKTVLNGVNLNHVSGFVLLLLSYLGVSAGTDFFRYTNRMSVLAVGTVAMASGNLVVAGMWVWWKGAIDLDELVAAQAISSAAVAAWLWSRVVREIGVETKLNKFREYVQDMKLGFPIIMATTMEILLGSSSRYLITWFLSLSDLGAYAPAFSIGAFVLFIPKIAGVVLVPMLAREEDRESGADSKKMVELTFRAFLILGIPFVVGAAFMGRWLLRVLANEQVAAQAWLCVPILAAGSVVYGINYILFSVLFVKCETRLMFKANLLATVVNVVLTVLLLWWFHSIVGAAVGWLAAHVSAFFLIYGMNKKEERLRVWGVSRMIGASGIMGAVMLVIGWLAPGLSIRGDLAWILIPVGACVYGVAILMLGGISAEEKAHLRMAFSSAKS